MTSPAARPAAAADGAPPTTHAVGLWPALEALRHRPGRVRAVLVDPDAPEREAAELAAAAARAGVRLAVDRERVRRRRRHAAAWVVTELAVEDDRLEPALDHLVLVRPAQAGNVGAALRAALGFGVRDVAVLGGRIDPWAPHVLRASQGARFALRVRSWAAWADYRRDHPDHAVLALVPPTTRTPVPATPLPDLAPPARAAWVVGPEAGGLPDEVLAVATPVTIPQDPELESHNLAVAVGVALFARAAARGRAATTPSARPTSQGGRP